MKTATTTTVTLLGLNFGDLPSYDITGRHILEAQIKAQLGQFPNVETLTAPKGETYPLLKKFIGTFDVVYVELGGKKVDIFCDDNGLLHEGKSFAWKIIADNGKSVTLAGPILFATCDEEGETTSCPFTEQEIRELVVGGQVQPIVIKSN